MNVTIRVRLTPDAERALAILTGLLKKNKKEVLDEVVHESSESLLKRFSIPSSSGKSKNQAVARRIASLKDSFESKAGEVKSYAISSENKKALKHTSQALGVKMGVALSILLEDQIRALVEAVERQPKVEMLLKQMAEIKSKIANDVYSMEKLWDELVSLYPNDEENSPFYFDLTNFFVCFDQFNP